MTLQEIFDKAAKHLLTQNAKAIIASEEPNMTGSCKYLDPKTGYTCAVGCFFDKRTYTLKFEGEPVSLLFKEFPYTMDKVFSLANEKDKAYKLALLSDLQMVHDGVDVINWAQKLIEVAERHNLIMIEVSMVAETIVLERRELIEIVVMINKNWPKQTKQTIETKAIEALNNGDDSEVTYDKLVFVDIKE